MENLRRYLAESNVRQSAFAKRVGLSASYMSQLVNGMRSPSLRLAQRIEQASAGAVPVSGWIAANPPPERSAAE